MRRLDAVIDALALAVLVTVAGAWIAGVCTAQDRSIDAAYAARRR